jgi:hypothetical protein
MEAFEEDRAIDHMLDVRDEDVLVGDSRFREVSERLDAEGIDRGFFALKNFWNRVGRARSGFDERRARSGPLATSMRGKAHTRKRSAESDGDEELQNGIISQRRTSKRQKLLHESGGKPLVSTVLPDDTQVREHMENNVVCLFYSPQSQAPRVRLFSACNTVQKLFGQATAGDLFDEEGKSNSGTQVLLVKLGNMLGGELTKMAVLKDDEEDFEAFVKALIKETTWWTISEGAVQGSGTVEIRLAG